MYPTVAAMSSCEPQVWELRLVEDTPVLVEEGGGSSLLSTKVYSTGLSPCPQFTEWKLYNKMLIRCKNSGKSLFYFQKNLTELISLNVFPAERPLSL